MPISSLSFSVTSSRVSDQNGVSPLYIMLEIHHSGREPSICTQNIPCTHFFLGDYWGVTICDGPSEISSLSYMWVYVVPARAVHEILGGINGTVNDRSLPKC